MRPRHLIPLLAVPALAAGCGGAAQSGAGAAHAPGTGSHAMKMPMGPGSAPTAPGARVSFVTPRGGVATGSTVQVRVRLSHFRLAPSMVGMSPRPGFGHLHFVMDGGRYDHPRYSGANGVLGAKLGVSGQYSPSVTTSIVYRHLPRGRHTLVVELANNNHTLTGVHAVTHVTVG